MSRCHLSSFVISEKCHAKYSDEQSGEPGPPMTRVVKSLFHGSGPATAVVRRF
jgi:hypothetical protein